MPMELPLDKMSVAEKCYYELDGDPSWTRDRLRETCHVEREVITAIENP